MTSLVIVPGLGNSGPAHWQTQFERLYPNVSRVEQANWEKPAVEDWCAQLQATLQDVVGPVVLVAHSLGCIAVALWSQRYQTERVAGALLVAPADTESPSAPEVIRPFAPIPEGALPFPSTVVFSRDDPFATPDRSRHFARCWRAQAVDAGHLGHINSESGLGTWPAGQRWLESLLRQAPFVLDPRLAADTLPVAESSLSLLRLLNDSRYPWLVLVPKRSGVSEAFELDDGDEAQLARESSLVAKAIRSEFAVDKINVGMLGNVVRQLHVHHVGRRLDDPAWPGPVWGHSPRVPYDLAQLASLKARLSASELKDAFVF